MKKKAINIIGIILIIIFILGSIIIISQSVNGYRKNKNSIVNIINKKSKLPASFLSTLDESKLTGFKKKEDNNDIYFYNKNIKLSYYKPKDSSKYFLREIELNTDKYNILGISVGDDDKESWKELEKYGFKKRTGGIIDEKEWERLSIGIMIMDDLYINIENEDCYESDDDSERCYVSKITLGQYLSSSNSSG